MIKVTISNIFTAAICCTLLVANSYANEFTLNNHGFHRKSVTDSPDKFTEISDVSNNDECMKACNANTACLSYSFCGLPRNCILSRFSFASEKLRKHDKFWAKYGEIEALLDWNADKVERVKLKKNPSCKIQDKTLTEFFELRYPPEISDWHAMEVYPVDEINHCVKLAIDHQVDSFLLLLRDQLSPPGREPPPKFDETFKKLFGPVDSFQQNNRMVRPEIREEFRKIVAEADKHENLISRIYKHRNFQSSVKYQRICALHSSGSQTRVVFSPGLLEAIEFELGVLRHPLSGAANLKSIEKLKHQIKMREHTSALSSYYSLL